MGRGILRGAGGDENLKFNFIWPKHGLKKYGLEMSYLISFDKTSGVAYNSS